MNAMSSEGSGSGNEDEMTSGVRLVVLNLPEDEGEGLGFRLTRTLWDPYPWIREVTAGSRADSAGLQMGDCLLQADGKELLGLPVGQVAGLIRGDGAGRGVSLLVWNCGVDPSDDPELLWSCGGGARGERARRALAGCVRALACCVCGATCRRALSCMRSHLYCAACWARLERCALCRETLPAKDSSYSRNLVAEQVFEAIATEYELKETLRKPRETVSAYNSPNRSPNPSPAPNRKAKNQLSMMNKIKVVQFDEFGQRYNSDPNIHRSANKEYSRTVPKSTKHNEINAGNTSCGCQCQTVRKQEIPQIRIENTDNASDNYIGNGNILKANVIQHKLVTNLRQACSLADLQNTVVQTCKLSGLLHNLCECKTHNTSSSLDNLKSICNSNSDASVIVLPSPPIYVLTCDHNNKTENDVQ